MINGFTMMVVLQVLFMGMFLYWAIKDRFDEDDPPTGPDLPLS